MTEIPGEDRKNNGGGKRFKELENVTRKRNLSPTSCSKFIKFKREDLYIFDIYITHQQKI
jgi:hypothetical protein